MDNNSELIASAIAAAKNAYAPYSGFKVGAAILCADGRIFSGCNVENAAYGNTICAERAAVLAGVGAGSLSPHKPIVALALTGRGEGQDEDYCLPCGTCLQVLNEFSGDGTFMVLSSKNINDYLAYQFKDLLPHSFVLQNKK